MVTIKPPKPPGNVLEWGSVAEQECLVHQFLVFPPYAGLQTASVRLPPLSLSLAACCSSSLVRLVMHCPAMRRVPWHAGTDTGAGAVCAAKHAAELCACRFANLTWGHLHIPPMSGVNEKLADPLLR